MKAFCTSASNPLTKLFGLLFIFLSAGCSNEITVRTDFDKTVSISQHRRYNWLAQQGIESRNNPLYYNELNDSRIKSAVDEQLQAKGYALDTENPLMLVHYHIAVEERSVVRPEEFGYAYGRHWIDRPERIMRYSEGTLIIDFMDATNCKLIWRGWATSVLDDSRVIQEELLRRAVREIFKHFPESVYLATKQ